MSESIVLLGLGACWAAYLTWYWRAKSRHSSSPRADRIGSFSAGLGTLAGSTSRSRHGIGGPPALAPRSAEAAARRRREVLTALGVVCVITLLAAIALGPVALMIHVIADLVFGAYGYAVIQRRHEVAEQEMKVHLLYPESDDEALPARRAVSS